MTYDTLKATASAAFIAGTLALSGALPAMADATSTEIGLTYVWTAHEGQEERLIQTYQAVGDILEANEPGLIRYEISVSETGNQIIIHEVFEDGDALAFHLSETAAQFFPQLVEFATPGPFIFRGDVPEPLRAAAYGMDMGAIFTTEWTGFER